MVTAPQLQVHVDTVLSRRPTALVIDLSLVEFLGSAGISVLVQVRNDAVDMPFVVVAHGPATSRPLQLLGIDKVFPIYPCVADAINGLRLATDEVG
jgi:anti-anti-sigma factor